MEKWAAIKDFENSYEISTLGSVRNVVTGRLLKPFFTGEKRKQYATVRLCSRPRVDKKIHQLVLETFVGHQPSGGVACHLNDDTQDNALNNLAWGSLKTNAITCAKLGKRNDQKLRPEDFLKIVESRKSGVQGRVVAKQFGISEQRVCDIFKGRSHIGDAK
jgi:hypothetical protein